MSGDLDSVLNGEQTPVPEIETPAAPETQPEPVAQAPEPEAEEPKGPVRDEKGRFAPKGEKDEGASPAPQSEPPLDHAAILGERRRRQEAEARIRELEAQIARPAPQVPQSQPPVQAAPFEFNEDLYWSNPQQFLATFSQHIRQEVMREVPNIVTATTLDRAEAAARARYEDYDGARDAFYQAAVVNPQLAQKALIQPDPAEFAYQEGKRLLEMANYGSTNDYIEAEVARRLADAQKAPTAAPVIPTSLADAPASGPTGEAPARPMALDEIIARKR
jgi:hypothetical protein